MKLYKPEQKAKVLKDIFSRASECKERKEWLTNGDEINRFAYEGNHDFMYQSPANGTESDWFFKAALHKAAEYLETVGPSLYQNNPDRRVIPRPWASDIQRARSQIEQSYLNYTPNETDLAAHSRRSINQSLIYGMGAMWTGYNPKKGCTQNIYDDVKNVYLDPDAKVYEDMNFIIRKRCKPRWWLLDKYPEAKAKIAALQSSSKYGTYSSSEMIEFYEGHFRVGLHHYANGEAMDYTEKDGERYGVKSDNPKKYVFSIDGNCTLLAETDWEVPYFMDGKWPVEVVTYRDRDSGVYPASPLLPGLGHLKALNWIYTLYLSKTRFTTRTLLGIATYNGNTLGRDAVARALRGSQLEFIEFEVNGQEGITLKDLIQQFNFSTGVEEFERFVGIVEGAFERATGLTAFVSLGTTERQLRSAAEANMKDRIAHSRFEDMRVRVEQWQSKIARKEAQAARFLLNGQDIAKIFGPQAGQMWGELMPPAEVRAGQIREQIMQQAAASGIQPDPMQVEQAVGAQLQQDMQTGVVYDDWLREVDHSIESGSIRRPDIDQQLDAANVAMNQAFPSLMQAGQIMPAMVILNTWAKLNNMPDEVQQSLKQAEAAMIQQQQAQQQMQQQQAMQQQAMEQQNIQTDQAIEMMKAQQAAQPQA